MPPQLIRAPWWPLLVLFAVALAGGLAFNTVHARGRIISDVTGEPVKEVRFVAYGSRQYSVDADGVFDIGDLPRGAKLTVFVPGYNRKEFDAGETEVRLVVGVVTFQVNDAINKVGIPSPEARIGAGWTTRVGKGSETGNMAVAPAPDKNTDIFICAKDYTGQIARVVQPIQEVFLARQDGADCPPIPTPTPLPTVRPSGSPSPSPSASSTPTPTPTGSP